jgi:hypothetical protein
LADQTSALKLDLQRISVPEPVKLGGVFAAKARCDAEREAAIRRTRDGIIELAGALNRGAETEAEMLMQITGMAADAHEEAMAARNTHRWTRARCGSVLPCC